MPQRPKRRCRVPSCPGTTRDRNGYCDEHKRTVKRRQENRGNTTERGYGWDWQKLARAYKAEHPLCEDCLEEDKTTVGDDVDHIIPFRGINDPLRLDWDNLRNRCRPHHNAKTHGRK